jgi:hypothetical protein
MCHWFMEKNMRGGEATWPGKMGEEKQKKRQGGS